MNKDLMAVITIIAPGYDVTITINGSDIGVTGGKTESLKLFGKNHSMVPVLPEDMKKLVCLKEGDNAISFKLKRLNIESSSGLTIELKAKEQFLKDECLLTLNENIDAGSEKSVQKIFTL